MKIKKFDWDTYKQIDRYLQGRMGHEEAMDFEIKISLDKALEEAVQLRRLMIETIRHRRREDLKGFLKRNSSLRVSGNIWGKNFTRFSAFLIVVTGIFFFIINPDPAEESPGAPFMRGAQPDYEEENQEDTLDNF